MNAKPRCFSSTVAALVLMSLGTWPSYAAETETWQLLANAVPDECFSGIGAWPPSGPPNNQYPLAGACVAPAQLKTNESYVWGMTKYGSNLFFGTGQNILCGVMSQLGTTEPVLTDDYVCEFGVGPMNPAAGAIRDNRPPGMYLYKAGTGLVSLLSQLGPATALRNTTIGLRSGGSHQGVAFLAGPGLQSGINLFAFNADTGAFIGATALPNYNNVRKWMVGTDGYLYVGVGRSEAIGGGAVLRWRGSLGNPFAFEEVGSGIDADAAEIVEHEGRIFVSTWPTSNIGAGTTNPRGGGIWMSPVLSSVNPGNRDRWVRIWSASDYDPDPVTAKTYGGGALASFDGWLYWGTMHVPLASYLAHQKAYPDSGETEEAMLVGTWRAVSLFKGQSFGTQRQRIELLYGGSTLSVVPQGSFNAYLCPGGVATGCAASQRSWQVVPNRMDLVPRFGRAGLGNAYNNYGWTMEKWNGHLYFGTMDCSYLLFASGAELPPYVTLLGGDPVFGADLYRFDSAGSAAQVVSLDGMGNPLNYGIRTMVHDLAALYIGTANPMNLNPDGGWELFKLSETKKPRTQPPPH